MMPTSKLTAAALAGALTTIIMTEVQRRFGVTIDGNEGAAITTVLMFIAGYLTPHAQPPAPPAG